MQSMAEVGRAFHTSKTKLKEKKVSFVGKIAACHKGISSGMLMQGARRCLKRQHSPPFAPPLKKRMQSVAVTWPTSGIGCLHGNLPAETGAVTYGIKKGPVD
jgi:hypothetical protein